ncbi:D-erythro-7,8-dihydroneopterin triphosphate epimerase [Anaerolineae bacterium]|nr:D-erythro-7,8-dihydroneopterin triphosphate epimerase [Anaerolineae bacterium]
MSSDMIEIESLRLRCLIGFSEWELDKKQDVVIHMTLFTNIRKGGLSDNPDDILNYKTVNKAVIQMVEASHYKTLEALASAIARVAIVDCGAPHIRVRVEKPGALRFADSVAIVIERTIEDFQNA